MGSIEMTVNVEPGARVTLNSVAEFRKFRFVMGDAARLIVLLKGDRKITIDAQGAGSFVATLSPWVPYTHDTCYARSPEAAFEGLLKKMEK